MLKCVRQSCSPTKMAATVQLRCYWKQLWSRWAITGSWEPLVIELSTAVQPSWSEGRITRHNFGRGLSNDYFIKVWFQLSNWFQTRRFLCEFPIGSYVKLSSAVGAILVEGPNRLTLSHQDGHHSAVVLLWKAALIQMSDYRLLGASGYWIKMSDV
jgi:hypothetical protein